MQAQMQGVCGEDGAPVAAIEARVSLSRQVTAHAAPPFRLLPFPAAPQASDAPQPTEIP
jgi:hypothetical protein